MDDKAKAIDSGLRRDMRKARSENLGVRAKYILEDVGLKRDAMDVAAEVSKRQAKDAERGQKVEYPIDETDPTFIGIANVMCHNQEQYPKTARGYGITCPRDGEKDCSLVDALDLGVGADALDRPEEERLGKISPEAGEATHFISWVS